MLGSSAPLSTFIPYFYYALFLLVLTYNLGIINFIPNIYLLCPCVHKHVDIVSFV